MRKRKSLVFGAVLIVALVAVPAMGGCAPEGAAPPAEEKYVTFLSLTDLTGPIAGFTEPLEEAFSFVFQDVNARGGVDGVKIKQLSVDTRYDIARAMSAYKRYRHEHKLVMAFVPQTPSTKAMAPLIEKDKLVLTTPADGEFQGRIGRVFLCAPPYQDGCSACFDWVVEDWKAKGNAGMPIIGYLSWDSAYGREPLRGGKEYAEQLGLDLMEPEYFPMGAADHSVWLQRIAQGGADYCFIGGVDPTPSNILRDAYKLGLTETIQFVDCTYWGPDEALGIRLHPEATEGSVLVSPVLRGDEARDHTRVVDLWTKWADEPITEMRALFPAGIIVGGDFVHALELALEDVGYEQLDGDAVYEAYQKMTGFSRDGLAGDCTYSPTSRKPSDIVKFYRVENGKTVPITDWVKAPDAVALYEW